MIALMRFEVQLDQFFGLIHLNTSIFPKSMYHFEIEIGQRWLKDNGPHGLTGKEFFAVDFEAAFLLPKNLLGKLGSKQLRH